MMREDIGDLLDSMEIQNYHIDHILGNYYIVSRATRTIHGFAGAILTKLFYDLKEKRLSHSDLMGVSQLLQTLRPQRSDIVSGLTPMLASKFDIWKLMQLMLSKA
ncbi:hypothetical protein Fot_12278 [Forsythia ovata]|uniref:Uncharacterized protein n=1 Tax=Forsythia ovata TaxID=205694 RepID=A0ABD1WPW5_9LAMI